MKRVAERAQFRRSLPIGIETKNVEPLILICRREQASFQKPFFSFEFSKSALKRGRLLTLSEFQNPKMKRKKAKPDGFIFHSGRSGSTLLCRMLMTDRRNLVLSEPPILYSLLLLDLPRESRIALLRASVDQFWQSRRAHEKKLFIKFTSLCVLSLDEIREAFPETPWVYIHRDAAYTLSSQYVKPPTWQRDLPLLINRFLRQPLSRGVSLSRSRRLEAEVALLTRGLTKINRALKTSGMGLEYSEIAAGFPAKLESHFGLKLSKHSRNRMNEVLKFDAKSLSPHSRFRAASSDHLPRIDLEHVKGGAQLLKASRRFLSQIANDR